MPQILWRYDLKIEIDIIKEKFSSTSVTKDVKKRILDEVCGIISLDDNDTRYQFCLTRYYTFFALKINKKRKKKIDICEFFTAHFTQKDYYNRKMISWMVENIAMMQKTYNSCVERVK